MGLYLGKSMIVSKILDLHPETKKRRVTYKEDEKMRSVKYACFHGVTNAIRFFKKEFPNLTESTVRPLSVNTKKKLRESQQSV